MEWEYPSAGGYRLHNTVIYPIIPVRFSVPLARHSPSEALLSALERYCINQPSSAYEYRKYVQYVLEYDVHYVLVLASLKVCKYDCIRYILRYSSTVLVQLYRTYSTNVLVLVPVLYTGTRSSLPVLTVRVRRTDKSSGTYRYEYWVLYLYYKYSTDIL